MQQKPKGIAQRRHHREKRVAKAKHVLGTVWMGSIDPEYRNELPACKWADNLRKCSCIVCGGHQDPHDHRQFKQADAHLAFEIQRLRENYA